MTAAETAQTETRPALRENRRDLPRVETNSQAEVLLGENESISVQLVNLSRGGAQLGCSRAEAETMVLKGSIVSPDQGAQFWLSIVLPNDDTHPVKIRGRLAHSTPIGAGQHRIGIQFIDFVDDAKARVEGFIEASLV
ncbi:MAG: PilZ domain-containing protein [Pseudomonadota bacterium]